MQVLPVFFKLFECQDKALRQLLFRHIIAGEDMPSLRPQQKCLGKSLCLSCLEPALCSALSCSA